jgi:mono/diheme cytochrome c family protein
VIFKLLSSIPLLLALTSCRCQSGGSSEASKASPEAQLIARGRAVYVSNCTACHATNPKLHGSQGPDVYGSSKELLTARILEAKYPELAAVNYDNYDKLVEHYRTIEVLKK